MPPALQNPFTLWLVLSIALAAIVYFAVRKELRVRATLYGAFLLACAVAIWPVEDDAFHVRVDEKTKIKVLKTAIAGLQAPPPEMEKK